MRGIVFTLDAIIAMSIVLMTMGMVISFVSVNAQQNDNTLKLSRLARDVYDVSYYFDSGLVKPSMPQNVVNLCDDSFQQVGVTPEIKSYDNIALKGHDYDHDVINKWYYAGVKITTKHKKACIRGVR